MARFAEHKFQAAAHVFLCRALPDAVHWGTDHSGARSPIQGARLKQRGIIAGIPDHFTFYRGVLIAWEWKAGQNDVTGSQVAFGTRISKGGGWFYVCRTIDEIEQVLRRMGWQLSASAGGIDQKLAAPTAKKLARKRQEKPTTRDVKRMESLRAKVMF